MSLVASFQAQTSGRNARPSNGGFWENVSDAVNPFDRGGVSSQVRQQPGVSRGGTTTAVAAAPTPIWETVKRQAESARQSAIARSNRPPPLPVMIPRDNRREIDDIVKLLGTGYELNRSALQDSTNALINSNSLRNAAFAEKEAAARAQFQNRVDMSKLDTQGADIQLGNMGQWQTFLDTQHGNAVAQIAANRDHAYKLKTSAEDDRKLDQTDIANARTSLMKQVAKSRDAALEDAGVRGAIFSVGNDWDDIEDERLASDQKITAEDSRSSKALADRTADLDNNITNFNWDITNAGVSYEEQTAKLKERKQLLELEAEKARMSEIDMQNAMTSGLAQLGLESAMSQGQFAEAMANAKASEHALMVKFLQDIDAQNKAAAAWMEKAGGVGGGHVGVGVGTGAKPKPKSNNAFNFMGWGK